MTEPTKLPLQARIDSELFDTIARMAEEQKRSISNMTEILLEKAIASWGKK